MQLPFGLDGTVPCCGPDPRAAAIGGLGYAKTAANYAASMYATTQARREGFDQVLWLDSNEHRYVEEVGAMNIFFKRSGTVITPPLSGSADELPESLRGYAREGIAEVQLVLDPISLAWIEEFATVLERLDRVA